MIKLSTLLLFAAATCFASASASAFGFKTKLACAKDYYAYCSQHSLTSPALRQCMSAAGPKLSQGCISALIADGEVSRAEVERRQAALR